MSIRLSRKKINDMVDRDYSFSSSRSGGGSGAGGGGGVSSQWVDDHYVSKEFFARLFTINGTDENDDDVVVEPNDLETTITNIQAMVGLWTESYLSALGLNSGGGGGGGSSTLYDLNDVQIPAVMTQANNGQVLMYSYSAGKWINSNIGTGTITDVTLEMPIGFDISHSTVGSTVQLSVGFGDTLTKNQVLATPSDMDGSPLWRSLVADDIPDLSSIYVKNTDIAAYTWWGQTLQTVGQMKAVTGNIKMDNGTGIIFKKATGNSYYDVFDYNNSNNLVIGWGVREDSDTYLCGRTLQMAVYYTNTNNELVGRSVYYAGNDGNVGIGTTSPYTKLDVDGGVKATKFYLYKPNAANDTNAVYFQYVSDQSGVELVGAGLFTNSYVSALGANSQGGGGGTDLATVWQSLRTNTDAYANVQIDTGHLTTALSGFITQSTADNRYLKLTGGTLSGNLSVKGAHNLSLNDNGISQTSYLGYYINDTNNKRSAQYVNTVSANGNNAFWMSVTYDVSGSTTLDKGFGLTVDKQGNCTWRVDGAPEFRSAIGINLDNLVTTNTAQTISAAKLFSGGITPIAAGSVQTASAGNKLWIKQATVGDDSTPNNGLVLEYGTSQWTGQLYMADNGKDGLYWGGWHNGTRQSWMKILDTSSGVTLTTDQTITGTKTFSANVIHGNNTSISFNNTSDTACSVLTLNSSDNLVIGWGVKDTSDTYITGNTIQLNVGGSTSVFYATNGGNVGIGTTSPSYLLDVNGHASVTRLYLAPNVYLEYDSSKSGVQLVGAGFYTNSYVSALGANSQGGGGGVSLNTLLTSLNSTSLNPATVSNKVLVNSNGTWTWQDYIAGGGGGGSVTSVGMTVPTGFSVSPSSIDSSGTFAVSFGGSVTKNYVLASPSSAAGAPSWRALVAADIPDLSGTYATDARMDTVEGYFDSNGYAKTAVKLSTVSKTLWGNTYWTSGGVPTSVGVSGTTASLSYVGSISMAGDITGAGDITMGNKAQPKLTIGQDSTYYIRKASSSTLGYGVAIRAGGDGEQFAVYSTKTYTNKQLHTTIGLLSDGYVTALSDIRYKDVVAKVSPRVEDIAGASIIRYTWKFHADKTIHIGGIAQEWKVILPETVIDCGDKLSMDYGKIGAIAGIANARRIVDHETRIKQLEKENEQLRKELAAVQTTPNPS